jgi:hypothetical protein
MIQTGFLKERTKHIRRRTVFADEVQLMAAAQYYKPALSWL